MLQFSKTIAHTKTKVRWIIIVVVAVKANIDRIQRRIDRELGVRTDVGTGDKLETGKVGRWLFRICVALAFPIGTLLNPEDAFTAVKVHFWRVLTGNDIGHEEQCRTREDGEYESADQGLLVTGQFVSDRT